MWTCEMSRPPGRSDRPSVTRGRSSGNRLRRRSRYAGPESQRSRRSGRTSRWILGFRGSPFCQDVGQSRPDFDPLLRTPCFQAWEDLWLDYEAVDALSPEAGGEEPHRPQAEVEEGPLVRANGCVQEGHEAREEGDRANGPNGPLEPLRRAHHLALDRPDEAQLEAVQEPSSREERGEEPREQEDRERHEADGECAQVGGSLEILDLRHDEEVDRERADRHENRVPQTDRLRGRQPDIDALPAEELSMGFVGPSGERPRKRRDEPQCDGDQSNGEKIRGRLPNSRRVHAAAHERQEPVVKEECDREDDDESENVGAGGAVHGRPPSRDPIWSLRGKRYMRSERRRWSSIVRVRTSPIAR